MPQKDPDLEEELSSSALERAAIYLVVPVYILVAVLVRVFGGKEPLLAPAAAFAWFAVFCALGLACAIYSYWLREKLSARSAGRGESESFPKGTAFGLALSEMPAFLGLVYFILFRDWSGFAILLALSLLFFFMHAGRNPPTED